LYLLDKIIFNNQSILEDLTKALQNVDVFDSQLYAKPELVAGNASIGGHVRHIIDFYLAFFKGFEQKEIDYDQRERDHNVQTNVFVAQNKIQWICEQLAQLPKMPECILSVSVTTDAAIECMHGQSTLLRELQFIHSHTTHHMAIISIILRINGIFPDDNFGKAPSTVAFEQKQACVQ